MRECLVVDDDKTIHTLARATLARHGFQVRSAFDAVGALAAARQFRIDLIVLDIAMPGGGGYEAFRRLQSMSTTSHIPILVFSSAPPEQVRERIPPSAQVGHLVKPALPEDLLAAVQSLLP